ncbi:MAG: DUF1572 family protein [Bacteroidetes bacterium]|nr:DUF1572 family protein [Bacteroidota bacterium]MDA1120263.1 DUF1572 family protein [Bacteroidota bacterium]
MPRIKNCLERLSIDEIWTRPNDNLVSVGNLVLHLCGNVKQYILFGLDGQPDGRVRQNEFDNTGKISAEVLLQQLDDLMEKVTEVLDSLSPDLLTNKITVQEMVYTGFGILLHVVEHFSYHVGPITWHTKLIKNVDVKYYEGKDLDITG